ncbi:MAG TPA: serine protease [Planctomycetota bacterium]|nr:serine protease [Planctomycetota bacterium]
MNKRLWALFLIPALSLRAQDADEDPPVEVPSGDAGHFKPDQWKRAEASIRKARVCVVRLALPGNMGSGVVIKWKGELYLLSVAHNFAEGGIKEIRLPGRPTEEAALKVERVALDAAADVAVFKILDPPKGTPFVEVKDKAGVSKNDRVLALSYPLGRGLKKGYPVADVGIVTSTSGMISACDVYVAHRAGVPDGLQVTVGPGSSGGGLFDPEGRLIGLLRSVSGEKGQGVASAIPIETVLKYLP